MSRTKNLKNVLAANVRAVMTEKGLKQEHVAALAKQRGAEIDQTTVGRILRAAIPTTVDKLEALALALGLEPWQLLVKDLQPAKLPALSTDLGDDLRGLLAKYEGEKEHEAQATYAGREPIARVKESPRLQEPAANVYKKSRK